MRRTIHEGRNQLIQFWYRIKDKLPILEKIVTEETEGFSIGQPQCEKIHRRIKLELGCAEQDRDIIENSKHFTGPRMERYLKRAQLIIEERQRQEASNRNVAKRIEIAGYMPLRRDFDPEYDQEAESLVADLEFEEDDTEIETKLKREVLEMYECRLQERIVRKNFVIDHCIQELDRQAVLGKRTPKEKEILKQLIPFERFFSMDEMDSLVKKVATIRELKRRINLLDAFQKTDTFDKVEKKLLESRKKLAAEQRAKRAITNPSLPAEEPEQEDMKKMLTPVEKQLMYKLNIDHSVYNQLRYSLAYECLKQGYLKHTVDPENKTERFERTPAHQYTELFDFYAKLNPRLMTRSLRPPNPREPSQPHE